MSALAAGNKRSRRVAYEIATRIRQASKARLVARIATLGPRRKRATGNRDRESDSTRFRDALRRARRSRRRWRSRGDLISSGKKKKKERSFSRSPVRLKDTNYYLVSYLTNATPPPVTKNVSSVLLTRDERFFFFLKMRIIFSKKNEEGSSIFYQILGISSSTLLHV